MKRFLSLLLLLMPFVMSHAEQSVDVSQQLKYCHAQVKRALKTKALSDMQARNIVMGEKWWSVRPTVPPEWCSGFWPGVLWMDYQNTGDRKVLKSALAHTEAIAQIVSQPVYDHDLGFIVINSYMKGYEALDGIKDEMRREKLQTTYREQILLAAEKLSTLFNEKAGTLLSWPRHVKDYGGHNTIMDNMINLELLYWASEHGGNPNWAKIATQHAETTMKNHFRADGSSYHVAVYDTLTGELKKCLTHQGYADESMWTRGQSWAIYGYTMVYRYTHDRRFLDFAQKVADIYLERLRQTSDDWVPLWDMDAKPTAADSIASSEGSFRGVPKDASAAAVTASSLLDLSSIPSVKSDKYRNAAIAMLKDLSSSRYQSGKRNTAFLMHSTGNHPAGSEIDASIIYADYYYIEALLKLKKLSQ